jgi:hypothetical protein
LCISANAAPTTRQRAEQGWDREGDAAMQITPEAQVVLDIVRRVLRTRNSGRRCCQPVAPE